MTTPTTTATKPYQLLRNGSALLLLVSGLAHIANLWFRELSMEALGGALLGTLFVLLRGGGRLQGTAKLPFGTFLAAAAAMNRPRPRQLQERLRQVQLCAWNPVPSRVRGWSTTSALVPSSRICAMAAFRAAFKSSSP